MPQRLTRHSFLNGVACLRLGWFSRQDTPPAALSADHGTMADRLLADEEREVHDRARALFPDAVAVSRRTFEAACWQTQDLLDRPGTHTMIEAAFSAANCKVRADALVRDGEGWHLYEVKSRTFATGRMTDELAYAWMVLDGAGVSLLGASLVLISGSYRLGMADTEMFAAIEMTEPVRNRAEVFRSQLEHIDASTRTVEPPPARLISQCRECPLFRMCVGSGTAHHLFELPHLSRARAESLIDAGYTRIVDLPEEAALSRWQSAARQSVLSGSAVVTNALQAVLERIHWPVRYLDVECFAGPIPLLPGLAPFARLPFLYSVRLAESSNDPGSHRAFLAPHDRDGTRELAERLLNDLGDEGTVLVYSLYEERTLRLLARRHPDLADPLARAQARVVRLASIIRSGVYHPDFGGTTSFDRVLSALVPTFNYRDLEIEGAPSARAAYACLAKGGYYAPTRVPLVRRDLYAYCARDTLGLRRLHDALRLLPGGA